MNLIVSVAIVLLNLYVAFWREERGSFQHTGGSIQTLTSKVRIYSVIIPNMNFFICIFALSVKDKNQYNHLKKKRYGEEH